MLRPSHKYQTICHSPSSTGYPILQYQVYMNTLVQYLSLSRLLYRMVANAGEHGSIQPSMTARSCRTALPQSALYIRRRDHFYVLPLRRQSPAHYKHTAEDTSHRVFIV